MSRDVTLDAADLVLRVARATLGAAESPPNTNGGPYVERVLKSTGNNRGDPWCAAYVYDIGNSALQKQWPVVRSASCAAIGRWALANKCLYRPHIGAQKGDLFLLHYPKLGRFAHVGFVLSVNDDGSVQTIEGNSTADPKAGEAASREGWLVVSKIRRLKPTDALVRWVDVFNER